MREGSWEGGENYTTTVLSVSVEGSCAGHRSAGDAAE